MFETFVSTSICRLITLCNMSSISLLGWVGQSPELILDLIAALDIVLPSILDSCLNHLVGAPNWWGGNRIANESSAPRVKGK